jgi:hypothetical protein
MSEIEEIRRRHQERQAGEEPADYSLAFEEAHEDRAALLAALDGEWQSERPTEGEWFVSRAPAMRHGNRAKVEYVDVDGSCGVWSAEPGMDGGYIAQSDDPIFAGALWQRRTVPRDPFKNEDKHE